jgi:gamma-glutamylcyclotransferase (GGCT)/AIG2-like uncharacterized protein YtfP
MGQRESLFVYGSLVRRAVLVQVLGHPHWGEQLRAQLRGWRKVQTPAYGYPFLVPDPHGLVDGVVLLDLSAEDLARLDVYEEVDERVYERTAVEVTCWSCGPGDTTLRAWTYVAGPTLRELARGGLAGDGQTGG